jgi:hypothetical protein
MSRLPILLGTACLMLALGNSARAADDPDFARDVAPLLAKYCTTCHGGAKPKGKLALDQFKDQDAALKNLKVWEDVADNLRSGDMPPPDKPRPSEAELEKVNAWLDRFVFKQQAAKRDPGRVTLRRLNRAEYNNTVRDLLGVDFRPADDFPSDDVGYGFDNIGDVLSLSPLLLEKYLAASEQVVEKAFASEEARKRALATRTDALAKKPGPTREILRTFAERAYRRPVAADELRRLLRLAEAGQRTGGSPEAGLKLAMQAVLVSPHFLFRVEADPGPGDPDGVRTLNDWELASRLSYFLWSSMPDEELFEHARKGTLRKDGNLEAQVRRMLKDDRSRALVENFAGQWLQLRNLKDFAPDPGLSPDFDEKLRQAMRRETELFFGHVMREDRSVLEFLDADYTFLNERLAKHYGIPGVEGEEFGRVELKDRTRGGLLTQASVLSVTSNPTRTSPVKRGKWILENILGTPPKDPPPGVPELKEGEQAQLTGSLRQRMEQHRANPNCAACHQSMDALGFGFENFDAIGAWRTQEGKHAIDPSGTLPNGQSFKGPAELKALLKARGDAFARCLTDKLLTYALGRGTERTDRVFVEEIAREAAGEKYPFSSLVIGIVKSDPFQKRRGKRENP